MYPLVSWDERNSKVSQEDMNLSLYDTRMCPVQITGILYMKEMIMQDQIKSISQNQYKNDENPSNIGRIAELITEHTFMVVFPN